MLACNRNDMLSAGANKTCMMSDVTKLSQHKNLHLLGCQSAADALACSSYFETQGSCYLKAVMRLSCFYHAAARGAAEQAFAKLMSAQTHVNGCIAMLICKQQQPFPVPQQC